MLGKCILNWSDISEKTGVVFSDRYRNLYSYGSGYMTVRARAPDQAVRALVSL